MPDSRTAFPWDSLPKDAVVIDVSGGIGSVTFRIAAAHPHLRYIVQDREQTIAVAPKAWDDQQKAVFGAGRIAFQAQDFFAPQPAVYRVAGVGGVKHPSVFVVTRVMHNWGDEKCLRQVCAPLVLCRKLTAPPLYAGSSGTFVLLRGQIRSC